MPVGTQFCNEKIENYQKFKIVIAHMYTKNKMVSFYKYLSNFLRRQTTKWTKTFAPMYDPVDHQIERNYFAQPYLKDIKETKSSAVRA